MEQTSGELAGPAVMSATEVIEWIAFRRRATWADWVAEQREYEARWLDVSNTEVLDALRARAASAPFCLLLQFPLQGGAVHSRERIAYLHAVGSPRGPALLRTIRARARQRLGRLVSFSELAVLLERDLPDIHARFDARRSAKVLLIDSVLARKLTAMGQPDAEDGRVNDIALFATVPREMWLHREISLRQDRLTWPGSLGSGAVGRSFSNVHFETAAVAAIWPVPVLNMNAMAEPRAISEPAPAYSEPALRAWYLLRFKTWNEAHPPPSESDDLAAAKAYFHREIPRDLFRKIRQGLAPASWKKPGPRRKRE